MPQQSSQRLETPRDARRWSGENRGVDGTAISVASERGSTARTCPSSQLGSCEAISTIREKSRICWSGRMRDTGAKSKKLLARCVGALDGYLELKRFNESITILRIVWRNLPRNGGRALFLLCPHCDTPRRHVHGWEWDSFSGWSNRVRRTDWCCRSCNRLRYSSEGGALMMRGGPISRLLRMDLPDIYSPRPKPWLPHVFTAPEAAAEARLCTLGQTE